MSEQALPRSLIPSSRVFWAFNDRQIANSPLAGASASVSIRSEASPRQEPLPNVKRPRVFLGLLCREDNRASAILAAL